MVKKSSIADLAVFGGPPLFHEPKPIGQLAVPDVEGYLELVRRACSSRVLSEGGAIVRELEAALADYHGVTHCIAVTNAGIGIAMLVQIFADGRRGKVVMPGFSYRGLPHLVQWAGQMPRFCDVDPRTHGLDPERLEETLDSCVSSILAVCNFNSPGPLGPLCQVAAAHGIPIFFDSVYAMGASYGGRLLGPFGRAEVYSTHATKLLNGFEGGYITTNDGDLAARLRRQRTVASSAHMPAHGAVVPLDGSLNELHAAMALSSLERLEDVIAANKARFKTYREIFESLKGFALVPLENEAREQHNFCMAVGDVGEQWALSRDEMVLLLRAEGIGIGPYYSPPLHKSIHCPPGIEVPDLPVSEGLAERLIQLPVGGLVSCEDIYMVGEVLERVNREGPAIAARLRAA